MEQLWIECTGNIAYISIELGTNLPKNPHWKIAGYGVAQKSKTQTFVAGAAKRWLFPSVDITMSSTEKFKNRKTNELIEDSFALVKQMIG